MSELEDHGVEPGVSVLERFRLTNKRALVTGAGRGIGRGCAVALAAAGAREVVLVGRTAEHLESTAAAVRDLGATATPCICDITDLDALSGLEALRGIDVLVNNAGTNEPAPFLEVTPESFDRVAGLNLRSLYFLTQAVVADMVAFGRTGSVVNLSSQMGLVGSARRSVYCATKHAVEGFTKAVAVELAPFAVRVNSVAPTYLRTPLTEPFFADAQFAASVTSVMPMGRIGRIEEVLGAVVYLASDAASLVTGSCLVVDGGWTAQ